MIVNDLKIESSINSYLPVAKAKLEENFGTITDEVWAALFSFIKENLKNYNTDGDVQLSFLEENIDNVILDLSELYPVFAYELNGQYKIKDRLSAGNKYIDDMEQHINQLPFNFKDWIKPQLTQKLAADLSEMLLKISKRVSPDLRQEIAEKIRTQDKKENKDEDDIEMISFLDLYIEKIKSSAPSDQLLNKQGLAFI